MKLDLHTAPRRWVFLVGMALVVWILGFLLAVWLVRYDDGAALCGFFLALGAGAIGWSLTYASDSNTGGRGFDVLEADEVTPPPERR